MHGMALREKLFADFPIGQPLPRHVENFLLNSGQIVQLFSITLLPFRITPACEQI